MSLLGSKIMPTIISIVGRAKSGKTTFIEKLISHLKIKGYKIGTIKNTSHNVMIDKPGSDTWRHMQSGSQITVLNASNAIVMIKYKDPDHDSDDVEGLIKLFDSNVDLIIVEGFKTSNLPKILIHRKTAGTPLEGLNNVIAIGTDEKLEIYQDVEQFDINDTDKAIEIINKYFIKSKKNKSL